MICYPFQDVGTSGAEKEIVDYIKSITTELVLENTNKILPSGKELDIYIPSKKLAIEFDGLYWHSELAGKNKLYHLQKTEECESEGIQLFHIFEDEWKSKKEIVQRKLQSKLIQTKQLGARKLTIAPIPCAQKNEFLEKYHIQGGDLASIRYGGFYNNELVAVATFGKMRMALGSKSCHKDTFELIRFATSIPVVGALSKMINVFKNEYHPKKIISYADRRYSCINKNIYTAVGMILSHASPPNYWYFRNGYYNRSHRFGFRKQILKKRLPTFDPTLTEWQNMQHNGFNRIWDCGNLKYELKLSDTNIS